MTMTYRTRFRAFWMRWIGSAGGGVIDFERLRSRFRFKVVLSARFPFGVLSIDLSASSSLSSSSDDDEVRLFTT